MKKEFEYIVHGGIDLRLKLELITSSILWKRNGLFGLIPFARIQNALECWKDSLLGIPGGTPMADFHWPDTIKVSPQIANALLGDDKDDKCTYNSKSSTDRS